MAHLYYNRYNSGMKLEELDYKLPKSLIAQSPASPRDTARMMVINKETGSIEDRHFYDLPNILTKNDCLVFNKTKVFPARVFGKKPSGGKVEILLLKNIDQYHWEVLTKPGIKQNQQVIFDKFYAVCTQEGNPAIFEFNQPYLNLLHLLEKVGATPLPPYIKSSQKEKILRQQYQTVYAKILGSAAAPTAGLHFTNHLLTKLKSKGIQFEYVTLHVGLGTFAPVKEKHLEDHQIHEEYFEIDPKTLKRIFAAKKQGKRIIAVGTTTTRVLESLPKRKGYTNLFIYPPYNFHLVDALITNFHLPKSTLLALIYAFMGSGLTKNAYKLAIKKKYRFFSFGDGMLVV